MTVRDYLLMGGYAEAVWPAYGVAFLVSVVFAVDSWRRLRRATARLRRFEAEGSARASSRRCRTIAAESFENEPDDRTIAKPRDHLEAVRRADS
jgi:heme exporter protein CcmD